jgi:hypothetical protein
VQYCMEFLYCLEFDLSAQTKPWIFLMFIGVMKFRSQYVIIRITCSISFRKWFEFFLFKASVCLHTALHSDTFKLSAFRCLTSSRNMTYFCVEMTVYGNGCSDTLLSLGLQMHEMHHRLEPKGTILFVVIHVIHLIPECKISPMFNYPFKA